LHRTCCFEAVGPAWALRRLLRFRWEVPVRKNVGGFFGLVGDERAVLPT
jgi:hypothetical protein